MGSEVGSGQVAIFPTFKGFRRAVSAEADGASREAGTRFSSGFRSVGATAGRQFGSSFKSATGNLTSDSLRAASADVAKSSRAVAAARLRELDAAGKVRIAEAGLAEARARYGDGTAQVVRAEERLAAAQRNEVSLEGRVREATQSLAASKRSLAAASDLASTSGSRFGRIFSGLPPIMGAAGREGGSKFRSELIGVLGGVVGGNILTGIGYTIGHLINNGIQAGVGVGLQSIQLASDLNETSSAIKQVFGSAAADIVSFSKTSDRALGQTQQEALQGAQTFGIFAKSAGLTGKPLSTFSTGLVTLAGDLASFYNTSPSDAIEALSAGLRGESEPLRRYGILLDDQTLRAKAFKLGIYDGNGVLTQQQRILAAQAVIMQQSTIAQGDFARTSGGLANQQRIFQASLTDTETRLGTFFLPGANKFLAYANSTFLPQLGTVIDRVGPKLAKALDEAGPGAKRLLDDVGPLADKLADAAANGLPGFIGGLDDFTKAAPGIISWFEKVNKEGSDFVDWLDGGKGSSQEAIKSFFGDVAKNAQDGLKSALPGGLFGGTFVDQGSASGKAAAKSFATGFLGVASPAATAAGITSANDFGLGMIGQLPVVTGAGGQVGKAASDGFRTHLPEWLTYGQQLGQGLVLGANSKIPDVAAAGARLGHAMSTATKRAMVISSPSKLAFGFGAYYGQGLALGADSQQANVAQSGRALASAMALQAIPSAPAYARASAGQGAQSSWAGPSTLVVVDADGHVMAHLQVAADQSFDRKFSAIKSESLAGGVV